MRTHRGLPVYEDAFEAGHALFSRRVRVYRNLHLQGTVWSIADASTGLVIGYADAINLLGVQWVVRPAGREKVRRERKKTVHAFAVGKVTMPPLHAPTALKVTYNPYSNDFAGFYFPQMSVGVKQTSFAYLGQLGVRAWGTFIS